MLSEKEGLEGRGEGFEPKVKEKQMNFKFPNVTEKGCNLQMINLRVVCFYPPAKFILFTSTLLIYIFYFLKIV